MYAGEAWDNNGGDKYYTVGCVITPETLSIIAERKAKAEAERYARVLCFCSILSFGVF